MAHKHADGPSPTDSFAVNRSPLAPSIPLAALGDFSVPGVLAAPTVLVPGEGQAFKALKPARRRSVSPASDEIAQRRAKRAMERARVESYVEQRLEALEYTEVFSVPRMHVFIAGSLAPASALKLIELWSEQSYREHNTPWVSMPLEQWIAHSGLAEEDWVAARQTLRELGLIKERSRFDAEKSALVTEVAFMADVFSAEVARLRVELRADAWERLHADNLD